MTDRELIEQWLRPGAIVPVNNNTVCVLVEALRDRLAHPEREWVGLTDEEIIEVVGQITTYRGEYMVCVGNAIEAKLKEKNS